VKVALLTPSYWPEVRRGTERIVNELARSLVGNGHAVRVITSHSGPTSTCVEDGIGVMRIRRPPDRWLRSRQFEDHLTHVPASYLALRRWDADLAHSFFATDALAAGLWARQKGCPSIFTFTGIPDRQGLLDRRGRLALTVAAAHRADVMTVVSQAAAAAGKRWLDVNSRVIYPSVDLAAFTPDPQARAAVPTIFCPAAIEDPRKGIAELLAAFSLVRRAHPSARLVLLRPSEPLAGRLEGKHPGLELAPQTRERSSLAALYRDAWVTALPSIAEAFGIVLIESLACGTPVTGSPHGGAREVIDMPATGRVAASLEPESLACSLLECIELCKTDGTPKACRGQAEHFSSGRMLTAYEGLYRELAAR